MQQVENYQKSDYLNSSMLKKILMNSFLATKIILGISSKNSVEKCGIGQPNYVLLNEASSVKFQNHL